jgi:lipopolysaccharide transport system ATP-binding protein
MTAAVEIENLGKRYRIAHRAPGEDGLRHAIERAVRRPFRALRGAGPRPGLEEFWALRGVSLSIAAGDVVGVVGRNGAGKSTLLKLLSRITVPTEGRIRIRGRVASLLEVGTGFHQELTGRENIFLNGAILGMSRAEIVRRFDEIVAFSEIETFLDTPVKRYSSGMYVRLAYAVAAHLDPEILIVDEVLAVGDAAFQRKCLDQMGTLARSGRTVLFVSHNTEAVRSLCRRGIWMKQGEVRRDGPIDETLEAYLADTTVAGGFRHESAEYGFAIRGVALENAAGQPTAQFAPGEDLVVAIDCEARRPLAGPLVILAIQGARGTCFTANMLLDGSAPRELSGRGVVRCRFPELPLLPQGYSVRLAVRAANGRDTIVPYHDVAHFQVAGRLESYGFEGRFLSRAAESTPVVVPYEWLLPDGSRHRHSLSPGGRREPRGPAEGPPPASSFASSSAGPGPRCAVPGSPAQPEPHPEQHPEGQPEGQFAP